MLKKHRDHVSCVAHRLERKREVLTGKELTLQIDADWPVVVP